MYDLVHICVCPGSCRCQIRVGGVLYCRRSIRMPRRRSTAATLWGYPVGEHCLTYQDPLT